MGNQRGRHSTDQRVISGGTGGYASRLLHAQPRLGPLESSSVSALATLRAGFWRCGGSVRPSAPNVRRWNKFLETSGELFKIVGDPIIPLRKVASHCGQAALVSCRVVALLRKWTVWRCREEGGGVRPGWDDRANYRRGSLRAPRSHFPGGMPAVPSMVSAALVAS